MPITFTFDLNGNIPDSNDRTRIIACFTRLGWEHIGGSAWRYPALGTSNASEDWFNHVIPALMYFRSLVEHGGITVDTFTIDAHSEAGYRRSANASLALPANRGAPIQDSNAIITYPVLVPSYDSALSDARLKKFLSDAANSLHST